MPAGDKTGITNGDIDVMKRMKWYSFDQYKIKAFSVWGFTLPMDKLKWDGTKVYAIVQRLKKIHV